ncbi:MAG: hypothetical protein V1744_03665 [Candidatus Altiarchaeota archaeon]
MRLAASVILLVLLSGCTMLPCNPPMKRIGGECCLDGDNNQVCDKNEAGNEADKECEPPYILSSGECCLDTNGNGACDTEETTENRPQAAAQVINPTTTTQQPTTTTQNTNPTTTSTATTSTVRVYQTPTTLPVCFDTDGGESPNLAGVTSGLYRAPPHGLTSSADYCLNNVSVREYRCEGDLVYGRDILCKSQETCVKGRCCLPSGVKCSSSTECCNKECIKKQYIGLCY